jgi:tight adherence protein C
MDPQIILAAGAFVALLLVSFGLYGLIRLREERDTIVARVADMSSPHGTPTEEAPMGGSLSQPGKKALFKLMNSLGARIRPQNPDDLSLLQKRFLRAGLRGRNVVVTFFGAKALLALCFSIGFILCQIAFRWQIKPYPFVVVVFILLVLGFYLPNIWLGLKISRRQDEFLRGFPDALDLLVVCAEAGMGLDAAIKRVGEEMRISSKVVSDEFLLLNLELRAGKQRKDAMRALADRVDLDDAKSWVTLLIQTDKFGTSVAQALRVHSDSIRTKRSMKVEELAAKLPVKLLFPTILLIFPSLFLVIIGPALIRIWRVWSGH